MLTGKMVTVGSAATDLLAGIDTDRELEVTLHMISGSQTFLGDSNVALNNGYVLGTSPMTLHLHGDTIWAISSTSSVIEILIVGVK